MDYQALINETKQKIDNYSFDDSAYTEIYEKAKTKLTNAYNAGTKEINRSLGEARKKAMEDNALSTKSLQESLAVRGLARSGESAMLKINQQLSLNDALANLSGEAMRSQSELYSQHQKELADLSAELGKQKASAMESEKSILYNRLADLEQLKADDDKWRSEFYAATYKGDDDGDKDDGDKDDGDGGNYQGAVSGMLSGFLTGVGNKNGETPELSAEKLAKNILTTCGVDDGIIRSSTMQQRIYKELARLICSGNYSKEYATEVLNTLRSHGFSMDFSVETARSNVVKTAYYVYKTTYSDYYNALLASGFNVNEAAVRAKAQSQKHVINMLKAKKLSQKEYNETINMLWMLD